MRERAKDSAWTIAGLLHVVAFGGFVDLRMELLFRPCVTIRTRVSLLAVPRLAPFLAVFHVRAWRRSTISDIQFNNIFLSHSSLNRDCGVNKSIALGFTYICISVDCASCPCYCDIGDRRSLAGTASAVSCTARSCSCSTRNLCPATLDPRSSDFAPCRVY